jgi:4-oxalocrotonate tautomerase
MPLIRIDLPKGKPSSYSTAVGDAVMQALHTTMGVPLAERFQMITTHPAEGLSIDRSYLGVDRSANALVVQIFLNAGRDAATKRHFYAALADRLQEAVGLRRQDLVINLAEVRPEDWSFGDGEAQLAR